MLPQWLESIRKDLEKFLPPVHLPHMKEKRARTSVEQKPTS
jgi:hypothetical protein